MQKHEVNRGRSRAGGGAPRASDIPALKAFLRGPRCPADAMSYHAMQGFLFAVTAAPDMVMPSEFFPLIWGEKEPEFKDAAEARAVIGGLMALYNEVNAGISDSGASLPRDCPLLDDPVANFEPEAPVSQWARGFITGHSWLEKCWQDPLVENSDDDILAFVVTLAFFQSRRLAEKMLNKGLLAAPTLDEIAQRIHRAFPDALSAYARAGRRLFQQRMSEAPESSAPRREPKVGRNAPCPCGSGEKHKRCCGRTH